MDCDYLIVGQGLAGAVLGWQLHFHGRKVIFIDRGEDITASKIAAGLINPITGRRASLTWRWAEFHPAATAFYQQVESTVDGTFLRQNSLVRFIRDAAELDRWTKTLTNDHARACLSDPQPVPLVNDSLVDPGIDGIELETAYTLDIPGFLTASRAFFDTRSEEIDVATQVMPRSNAVEVDSDRGQILCRKMLFCQGADARRMNPYFDWVPFNCAKGEILTIRCEALAGEQRVLNGPGWIAPAPGSPDLFRAGSTYTHRDLTPIPTREGRQAIEEKLGTLLRVDFEVVDHRAAIRPIIRHSRALAGLHPTHSSLGFFNGLGSKGSLNAPALAAKLVAHLEQRQPLDNEIDLLQNL